MDQHASAWSRCLNSCLLTLATATLAIQKMGEQSVKQQVLESKEGATYFSGMRELVMSSKLTFKLVQSVPGYEKNTPNKTARSPRIQDFHAEHKAFQIPRQRSRLCHEKKTLLYSLEANNPNFVCIVLNGKLSTQTDPIRLSLQYSL